MIDWYYNARGDLVSKIGRRVTQWRVAAPALFTSDRPVVTFTFDDFPKSAVRGADIIEKHGGRAGFYACTSMSGETGPYGEMFDADTLADLHARGHEIGAHSHNHVDCSVASPDDAVANFEQNLTALEAMGHTAPVTSLAYPFGETRLETKRRVAEQFRICRGVLPGLNHNRIDRAHLRSFALSPSEAHLSNAVEAMKYLKHTNAWLIFYSHDVSPEPTGYGVTPEVIDRLCKMALDLGAVLTTPTDAAKLGGIEYP